MAGVEERADDFGKIVRDILKQFACLESSALGGPHTSLSLHELRVIELLGEAGPQMMRSLAEHLGVAVNSMTTLVDGLEQKGLAQRTRSDVDRRVIHVELTDLGKRTCDMATNAKLQFHRALLSVLTDAEQEILLLLFRKIAREGWTQVEKFSA